MHENRIWWQRPRAARPPGPRVRRWPWLAATALAACLAAACPAAAAAVGTAAAPPQRPLNCGAPDYFIQCYTPQAYEVAYGIAPLLSRGTDGSGQTVVLPELAEPPSSHGVIYTDIRQDLAVFDSRFGLPPATLRVVNSIAGSKTPYLAGTEEVEDTEMVHAIAPGAALDVVLVPQDAESSSADFAAAITKAIQEGIALHAAVISISASGGEHLLTRAEVARMNTALEQTRKQHVTVVASSGDTGAISDNGPPRQVSLPASDPLVLAAGGTTLDATGRPAPTTVRWPGTRAQKPPAEATAACSPGRPTKTGLPGSAPPAASPTWPPTPTPPPPWRWTSAAAACTQPRAPVPPPRCGRA
jgi:subtilase family serine protease